MMIRCIFYNMQMPKRLAQISYLTYAQRIFSGGSPVFHQYQANSFLSAAILKQPTPCESLADHRLCAITLEAMQQRRA